MGRYSTDKIFFYRTTFLIFNVYLHRGRIIAIVTPPFEAKGLIFE